jgi:phosphate starvation-inducible protein PhoH and related proteins
MSKKAWDNGTTKSIRLQNNLSSKTENQKDYIRNIVENDITICYGPAGTGKTFIAAGLACQALARGDIDSIILTRPMVQCSRGDSLGALKGTLSEKFQPYLMPLIYQIEYFLGKAQTGILIATDVIRLLPLELCRGMNFDNCYALLDESQNATYEQIKMFMTRIGNNSKICINGDTKQSDLYDCDFAEIIDRLQNLERVGISKLTKQDIQRNPLIASILGRLEDD